MHSAWVAQTFEATKRAKMAIYTYYTGEPTSAGETHRPSGGATTATASGCQKLYAAVAAGLPLLAVMGTLLLVTATLLLLSSPVLLLFSPLLLLAGSVVAGSLVGFGAAGAMALGGVFHLKMALGLGGGGGGGVMGRLVRAGKTVTESRQRVEEEEREVVGRGGGYYQRKVVVYPPDGI